MVWGHYYVEYVPPEGERKLKTGKCGKEVGVERGRMHTVKLIITAKWLGRARRNKERETAS